MLFLSVCSDSKKLKSAEYILLKYSINLLKYLGLF